MNIDPVSSAVAGSNALPTAPVSTAAPASVPAAPASNAQPAITFDATRQAAAQINEFLKSSSASVEFTVDSTSDQIIVRIVDAETNKLIRQIPSAETLAIAHALNRMSGLLFAQKT